MNIVVMIYGMLYVQLYVKRLVNYRQQISILLVLDLMPLALCKINDLVGAYPLLHE